MEVEVRVGRDDGRLSRGAGAPRTLGRYRLVTELGRGSTSIVYLAAIDGPGGFNKLFALKRLRSALAENATFVRMFLAEARVGAQLNHPNVVSTLEIDETDARPYIVMDYLDGQPLQGLLAAAAAAFLHLPLHMHLAALSGALEGLVHAHEAGEPDGTPLQIVHRDVSPHNVFVTSTGMPKLLDFGCAQTAGAPWTIPTSAGHAAYMSPEQASGKAVDARSDLFAVGVMLWEAVARRRFWPDTATKSEILTALASGALPTTRLTGLANAPDDLRSIIVKATAPKPSGRYDRAALLQADLQKVLRRITPPTFELRELGQRLTTVFAAERARLHALINAQQEIARTTGARAPMPSHAEARDGRTAPVSSPPPPQILSVPSGAEPSVESGPLPSFPLPDFDRPERRAQRTTWTVVALAGSALIGAALSTVHASAIDGPRTSLPIDRPRASLPAATGMAPAATPPAATKLAAPRAIEPDPAGPPPVPVDALPSPPPAPSAAAAAVGLPPAARRSPAPPVARPHVAVPPAAGSFTSTAAVPVAKTETSDHGPAAAPAPLADVSETANRPPHPIDSANPYAP